VLAEYFPAGAVQPAVVVAPEGDADAVVQAAQGVEGVASAAVYTGAPEGSVGAPSPAPPVVVDRLVRVDVVTLDAADPQAAAETLDTQDASARDLRVIVPVVLLVILLILWLLLRSVVAAVLLMAANVLSFAAALGVDYSIFLMTRVREEVGQYGTRDGVLRGLAVTGGVITSAGVVLAATFAALGIIPLLFLAQLAFIVSLGVLLDTLVVRSLLVPALVHDIGRRTWWPSRLSRVSTDEAALARTAHRAEDHHGEHALR